MTRENLITASHFFKAFKMPQQMLENAQRFNHKFSKDFFVAYSATPRHKKKQGRWVVPTWGAGHMQVHIAYNPYFKLLLILVVVSVVVVLFERCTTLYVIAIK